MLLNESTRMWSQFLIIYKHWKMLLNYKYLTLSFQHGKYRKKIRKKASLPVVFHHPSLVPSICPLWSNYQYTLQPDSGLVLSARCSAILGKVAMQLQAKYLSGHHCVGRKVLVSKTVVTGHMSSFILSNKLSRGLMNIAWIVPRTKKIYPG
jgi:hypothetical protein